MTQKPIKTGASPPPPLKGGWGGGEAASPVRREGVRDLSIAHKLWNLRWSTERLKTHAEEGPVAVSLKKAGDLISANSDQEKQK